MTTKMLDRIGHLLLGAALGLMLGVLMMALSGCEPKNHAPVNGGHTTCAKNGHVRICAPSDRR